MVLCCGAPYWDPLYGSALYWLALYWFALGWLAAYWGGLYRDALDHGGAAGLPGAHWESPEVCWVGQPPDQDEAGGGE
ncbi:hypothetical protein [Pseudonocardia zijingensis]|uniref:Uncharacterized protein n=1 Tax=Pseudonocardia zijingensis TaxID=153376 RepID=A0ABN1P909_9PSEU